MNAKRFINYQAPIPQRVTQDQIDYHHRVVSTGLVALEELGRIQDVLESSTTEFSPEEHSLIDASIEAVLKDFSKVEIDSIALEASRLALEEDEESSGGTKEWAIVTAIKKIWQWINKSLQWLLEKLGFEFDTEKKITKDKEKVEKKLREFKEYYEANKEEIDKLGKLKLLDETLLKKIAHLDTKLGPKELITTMENHTKLLEWLSGAMKGYESASKSLDTLVTNAFSLEISELYKAVEPFNFHLSLGNDLFDRKQVESASDNVKKAIEKTDANLAAAMVCIPLLSTKARLFRYTVPIDGLKDKSNPNSRVDTVKFFEASYEKEGEASVEGFGGSDILEFDKPAKDFMDTRLKEFPQIDSHKSAIERNLKATRDSTNTIASNPERFTKEGQKGKARNVSNVIATLTSSIIAQLADVIKTYNATRRSFDVCIDILNTFSKELENAIKDKDAKENEEDSKDSTDDKED